MQPTKDAMVFQLLAAAELDVNELLLLGGEIYASPDADSFNSTSVVERVTAIEPEAYDTVVTFLRKLGRPEYASLAAVQSEISDIREWDAIYSELNVLLEDYGKRDGVDFLVVEDDYGHRQQKVECNAPGWFQAPMTLLIQKLLEGYSDGWEVIVVGQTALDVPFAISIYKDKVREHDVAGNSE